MGILHFNIPSFILVYGQTLPLFMARLTDRYIAFSVQIELRSYLLKNAGKSCFTLFIGKEATFLLKWWK